MRTIVFSVLATLVFSTASYSQSLDAVVEAGNQSFDTKDYYNAFRAYERVLDFVEAGDYKGDWDTLYIKYRYAEAAQRFNYYTKADSVYTQLLKESDGKNMDVLARSTFNLARVKQSLAKDTIALNLIQLDAGMLEEAQSLYQAFLDEGLSQYLQAFPRQEKKDMVSEPLSPSAKSDFDAAATKGVTDCEAAIEVSLAHPQGRMLDKDTLSRLPNVVNSRFSELSPVLNGNTLYYSSVQFPSHPEGFRRQSRIYSQVMKATYEAGGLNTIDTVATLAPNSFFNDDSDFSHTIHSAFTPDGQWMYFSHCPQGRGLDPLCKLYRRKKNQNGWGEPVLLALNPDTATYTTTQPSVSYDARTGKQWLYFASDRPDGPAKGGLDLWRVEVVDGEPASNTLENLAAVNTEWNDATPFMHFLSGQLFFSSDRESSFGLYDIFVCKPTFSGTGAEGQTEGLPLPYNSGYNDQYYILTDDGGQAFFTSDRPESMRFIDSLDACCQDIYTYPIDISAELNVEVCGCGEDLTNSASLEIYDITYCDCEKESNRVDINALQKYHKYRLVASHPDYDTVRNVVVYFDGRYEGKLDTTVVLSPDYVDLVFIVQDSSDQTPLGPEAYSLDFTPLPERLGQSYRFQPNSEYTLTVQPNNSIYKAVSMNINTGRSGAVKCAPCDSTYYINLPVRCDPPPQLEDIVFYFDNDMPNRDSTLLPQPRYLANQRTNDRFTPPLTTPYAVQWPIYKRFNLQSKEVAARLVRNDTMAIGNTIWYNYKGYTNPDSLLSDALRYEVRPVGNSSRVEIKPNEEAVGAYIDNFFLNELIGNQDRFSRLITYFNEYLSTGRDASLTLKAYCSIRGNFEYNKLLARRRVRCVKQTMADGFIIESLLDEFFSSEEQEAWAQEKLEVENQKREALSRLAQQDLNTTFTPQAMQQTLENIERSKDRMLIINPNPPSSNDGTVRYAFSFNNEHRAKQGTLSIRSRINGSAETVEGTYDYNDPAMQDITLSLVIRQESGANNTTKYTFSFQDGRGDFILDSEPVGASEAARNFPDPSLNANSDEGGKYFLSAAFDRRVVISNIGLKGNECDNNITSSAPTNTTKNPGQP